MTPGTDSEHLLRDVLAESAEAEFQSALIEATVKRARRRRHRRQLQRATLVALGVLAVVFGASRSFLSRVLDHPDLVGMPSCEIVHTRPLPLGALVRTQPLQPGQLVATTAFASIVSTTSTSGGVRYINDEELLALVAPRPAVLVRVGPNAQELIFADRPDRNAVR